MRDDDLIALVQGGVFAECKTVRAILFWDRCSDGVNVAMQLVLSQDQRLLL